MPHQSGNEPIDDEEILYRRIPVSMGWYSEDTGLSPEAFEPRNDETTGISVYRAKYKTLEAAAKGLSKKGYFVAEFRVGDLRAAGMDIVSRPLPNDPGHAELPSLRCDNRESIEALNHKSLLTSLPLSIQGPFVTPRKDD